MPEREGVDKLHLLIEVGGYGMSFVWFTKEPKYIKGLAVYNFANKMTSSEIAKEIDNIIASNTFFEERSESVTICYDFKESLLVPAEYHERSAAAAMLDLVYGTGPASNVRTERIGDTDVHNYYAANERITSLLDSKYPGVIYYHATSLQLEREKATGKNMHVIIFHNCLKVFLFDNERILLVQQFHYDKPVDAAYHLLNCCSQHDIPADGVNLVLSGMIDAHSNLYNELYKYFLNIRFEEPIPGFTVHERIIFYPSHFFNHLSRLVACVS